MQSSRSQPPEAEELIYFFMPEKSSQALVDGASLLFLIKQHFLEKMNQTIQI